MIDNSDTLAYVYLHRQNDDKNKCILTPSQLIVIFKGKARHVELKNIHHISFGHKLLLLPIVAGGSFGPFFFIALLGDAFVPVISLLGFLGSVFLLYYGFSGKNTLRIELINDTYEIFLPKISANLKSFTKFVSIYISRNAPGVDSHFLYYIPVSQEEREKLNTVGKLELGEQGIFGIHYEDFKNKKDKEKYLEINIKNENLVVKYENDEKGNLRPKLYGEVAVKEQ